MMKRHSRIWLIGTALALVLPLAFTQSENPLANVVSLVILGVYLSSVNLFTFSAASNFKKFGFMLAAAVLFAPIHVLAIDFLTVKDFSDWRILSLMLILGLILYAVIAVVVAAMVTGRNPLRTPFLDSSA